MNMYDLLIIGAGPVGLYTAKLCENFGLNVLVIEEHKEIGKPPHCSGLISRKIERFFPEVSEVSGIVENRINSAVFHSPTTEITLRKKAGAYVINRVKFDQYIAKQVKSRVLLGTRVNKVRVENEVKVKTDRGVFHSEVLIGCDGVNSSVAKNFRVKPKEIVKGLIAIVGEENYSDSVDLYFDKERVKDGFLWKIPRGKTTEYGVLGCEVNFRDLERFFRVKNYKKFGGLIPLGCVRKSYFDRVLLIGDAAGQTKPWSCGGVIYGLLCAKIASGVIKKSFELGDFSESVLKEYENLWRGKIGNSIKLGMLFRKTLKGVNNFELELLFRKMKLLRWDWLDMDFVFKTGF